jgi:hypothetical protein
MSPDLPANVRTFVDQYDTSRGLSRAHSGSDARRTAANDEDVGLCHVWSSPVAMSRPFDTET